MSDGIAWRADLERVTKERDEARAALVDLADAADAYIGTSNLRTARAVLVNLIDGPAVSAARGRIGGAE